MPLAQEVSMGRKILDEEERSLVADTVVEVLEKKSNLDRDQLIQRLYKCLPDLKDHALGSGIKRGLTDKRYYRVKGRYSLQRNETDEGKENYYYSYVAEWWQTTWRCLTEIQKGKQFGMPDVSAVRWMTSKFIDDIELITTEVKRGRLGIGSLTQAYGYSKLAHRCYLASDDTDKLEEFRNQAERIGIGLLYINPDSPKKITEMLSSPRSEPSVASLQSHLAQVFNLVQCAWCGVFFRRKKGVTCVIERQRAAPVDPPLPLERFVCDDCARLFQPKTFSAW